ncbi:MAG: hemerythrin domain-containing protein [Burkholderiales bacterium]|nr:hemerythrin domain-containing protein [Burkholderiales bacterium]
MNAVAVKVSRPARPAAPPMPGFESLDRDHREMLKVLDDFESLLAHVGENGPDSVAKASAKHIQQFFSGAARQHHAEEERLIFPGLLASGDAELVQHVKRLQQDHGWLEEDWIELSTQIEAIANGYSWYDLNSLQHALPVFSALYREHIALEESIVYPAARRQVRAA